MASLCYEVVIIGGGPAGCATALALRNAGLDNILVCEASDYNHPRVGESIPPNTRGLFSRLGLWQAFELEAHETCLGSYSSWGDDKLGYNDFLFNPQGHGWHLDRLRFDQFMANECKLKGIELTTKMRFKSIQCDDKQYPINISFDDHPSVRCRFVVDATGQTAKVARQFGAKRKEQDNLMCVAAYYDIKEHDHAHDKAHDKAQPLKRMTLLEAVENGWWYTARLPGNRIITAISSDASIVKQQNLKQPVHWHNALSQTQHLSEALGTTSAPDKLHTWIAPSALLNPPAGTGWLAVGDAASSFDPISSQGIYKALLHGLNAAPAIVAWLQGDNQPLLEYRNTVAEQFIDYLEQRAYFYDLEQRWPEAEFWQRRQMKG